MSGLNWNKFQELGGDRRYNFECFCRAIVRRNFAAYGQIRGLSNQPGVEFHLQVEAFNLELGDVGRWWGWQCKWHERRRDGKLTANAKRDIKDSIDKTHKYLPDLTDWVLCTPYILSAADQKEVEEQTDQMTIHF